MSEKEVRLIDVELLKERINRQIKYCHGYVGNKKEVYKEALLAVKSIIHELEQKMGE
jgi:ribosomal protein L20